MECRKLELVEIEREDEKAVLVFIDGSDIRNVNLNRKVYDRASNRWLDDEEKAKKIDVICKDYLDTTFDKLEDLIGNSYEVFIYESFSALYPVETIDKFDISQKGEMIQTKIDSINVDEIAIKIQFKHDKKTYESKMTFAKYLEVKKEWFVDPVKKKRQFEKFEEKFGVPVKQAETLIGKDIMVEVKVAMNKYPYADIKKLPK